MPKVGKRYEQQARDSKEMVDGTLESDGMWTIGIKYVQEDSLEKRQDIGI